MADTEQKSASKALKAIISGGITGGLEICITFPTEFVKTQLQLDANTGQARRYKGIYDCAAQTVKTNGVLGLYRGLSVLLVGSIPKSAVRFGIFERLKDEFKDENGALSVYAKLLCGMAAGVGEAIFAVTPMETVKVKFINDQQLKEPRYKGLVNGMSTIIKEEGLRGCYQGVTATILKQGSNQAIRFFVKESLDDWYRGGDSKMKVPMQWTFMFGGIAGAASVFGNTPLDVVKTRMQGLDAHLYKNTVDCAVQIAKKEGPMAFYKGTVPRLSRVVLDVGITFVIFEEVKRIMNYVWPTN